jgi:hypothetical protein
MKNQHYCGLSTFPPPWSCGTQAWRASNVLPAWAVAATAAWHCSELRRSSSWPAMGADTPLPQRAAVAPPRLGAGPSGGPGGRPRTCSMSANSCLCDFVSHVNRTFGSMSAAGEATASRAPTLQAGFLAPVTRLAHRLRPDWRHSLALLGIGQPSSGSRRPPEEGAWSAPSPRPDFPPNFPPSRHLTGVLPVPLPVQLGPAPSRHPDFDVDLGACRSTLDIYLDI